MAEQVPGQDARAVRVVVRIAHLEVEMRRRIPDARPSDGPELLAPRDAGAATNGDPAEVHVAGAKIAPLGRVVLHADEAPSVSTSICMISRHERSS